MNLQLLLSLVALIVTLTEGERRVPFPADADARITSSRATEHINVLASDEMRGRDTPSEELDRTVDYIASQFQKLGLQPVSTQGYKLPYSLVSMDLDTIATTLALTVGGETTAIPLKKGFAPFEQTGEATVTKARIVFAGFGITSPENGYDDYANIDANGAVVVVFRGEPDNDDTSKFEGRRLTQYAFANHKKKNAMKHGAVAMLVLDAPRTKRSLMVNDHGWWRAGARRQRDLQLDTPTDGIPVLHTGQQVADLVFKDLDELVATVRIIDSTMTPASRAVADESKFSVSCSVKLIRSKVQAYNVAGMVRGAVFPDEYVVIGAHCDHVGVGKPNAEGDSIYNGADDNASGTTGMLMAAEALVTSAKRPDRSIVFVAFTAEEKGLLGSKAYVEHTPLPMEKCVAMVNMDMIGRCEESKLSIGGNLRCPDLIRINEEENAAAQRPLTLAYDIEQYFFRSDQASFAMKRIPVIFYFTGEHKDYHKQSDEISKINMSDLVAITRLATRVAWRAAHQPRTTYIPAGFED